MKKTTMKYRLTHLATTVWVGILCLGPANSLFSADRTSEWTEDRIVLSLQAGEHDRLDVPVSVLIDAGDARSVWIEFPDGQFGRSQLVEPGMLNAHARGKGKKELHFGVPELEKGKTLRVTAAISGKPVEGRGYEWRGEPRQSRRLSCGVCHQGISMPSPEELRLERAMLKTTGKVPPLELPRIFPTTKGRDFRWHAGLGRYQTSTCWECHGRHMIQYEFGQSLDESLPWTPDPFPVDREETRPAVRSVYHRVYRLKGDRPFADRPKADSAAGRAFLPSGIHFGFTRATLHPRHGDRRVIGYSDIIQRHVRILSEEAGKFIGRHSVLLEWVGERDGQAVQKPVSGTIEKPQTEVLLEEKRQVTVKNTRARNGSFALWIDFVSSLGPVDGIAHLDGAGPSDGLRFLLPIGLDTPPEFRRSTDWQAARFDLEGTTYTAVCFNHPDNSKSLPVPLSTDVDISRHAIGFGLSTRIDEASPIVVHYRLWFQEGDMPTEEIEALSNDLIDPIRIEVE